MYNLSLTPEQLEFRDTVRDFVENEVKPAAHDPKRLEPFEKPLLAGALAKASQMGLRALALSEEAGGAGADTLTTCIVLEELAAGDVDVAAVLAHTAVLAPALFDRMTPALRGRFLPQFMEDDGFHLAYAGRDPGAGLGWSYHRPQAAQAGAEPAAAKQGADWVVNGTLPFVANAPVAGLFAVQARSGAGAVTLFVPRGTPGLAVREPLKAVATAVRWHHGAGAAVSFKDCKVPADHLLGGEGQGPVVEPARIAVAAAAVNLGVARAAYDAAVDYSKIRRQGGRNIIEHQAIGTKLADCVIRLELARNIVWKAAWSLDHPDAAGDRGAPGLPLHVIARVYTAQAAHEVTLLAAECFGAMGVMRDMPLQKHVHDAMVLFHSEDADDAAKLAIAEAIAGYQRAAAAA